MQLINGHIVPMFNENNEILDKMKKIKEPNLKVIKFDAKDVIATSGPSEVKSVGAVMSGSQGVVVTRSEWGY